MYRIIRRAPWIALGAAGAYYLDAASGPARRRDLKERGRAFVERSRVPWTGEAGRSSEPGAAVSDAPLPPSVPDEIVQRRADQPAAEELAAGVTEQARVVLAERVLEESEWRVVDRAGASTEHRRSEETVAES